MRQIEVCGLSRFCPVQGISMRSFHNAAAISSVRPLAFSRNCGILIML
jgi:hypothetical protein